MSCRSLVGLFAVLVVLLVALTGCAGRRPAAPATLLRDGPYTLQVDLAIAGELADERGRGVIRADLTGQLTFAPDTTGTQVHTRILAVRDVYVEPALQRHSEVSDLRALRTVLLATDAHAALDAGAYDVLVPTETDRRSALAFYYKVFTRDLAPPAWLPAHLPEVGSASRTLRRGLHGGVVADIEETLTLAAVDRADEVQVAEFIHTVAVRGLPTVVNGRRVAVEIHERGVLKVDLTRGLPVRHTWERTELRVEDGDRMFRSTVALAASYAAVASDDPA